MIIVGWGGVEGSEEELGERGLAEGDVEELANRREGIARAPQRAEHRQCVRSSGATGGQAEGNRRRARRRRGVGEAASL